MQGEFKFNVLNILLETGYTLCMVQVIGVGVLRYVLRERTRSGAVRRENTEDTDWSASRVQNDKRCGAEGGKTNIMC